MPFPNNIYILYSDGFFEYVSHYLMMFFPQLVCADRFEELVHIMWM